MKNNEERIILDTNIFISFLISNKLYLLDQILEPKNNVILVFSDELYEEFISVALRPKFNKYFSGNDLQLISEYIIENSYFCNVQSLVNICRDYKDNFLLSLAIDSQADYLITGDSDLLVLKKIQNTKILTIAEYLELKLLN